MPWHLPQILQKILLYIYLCYIEQNHIQKIIKEFNFFLNLFAFLTYIFIQQILPMEKLPSINEMYSVIQESRDYSTIRKYQSSKKANSSKQYVTKKGSYLDDEIMFKCSPGPANKSNQQSDWSKIVVRNHKYGDRLTYVDQIQAENKKKNTPSPNSYNLVHDWTIPQKKNSNEIERVKSTFLDSNQFQSNQKPGPGFYNIRSDLGKKVKEYKFTENHSRQPLVQPKPNMATYTPISCSYNTFQKMQKIPKSPGIKQNTSQKDKKQNKPVKPKVPGPGEYQMINTWKGKDKIPKNASTYMDKISKGPSPTIYYH